jgi:hypothetical protein
VSGGIRPQNVPPRLGAPRPSRPRFLRHGVSLPIVSDDAHIGVIAPCYYPRVRWEEHMSLLKVFGATALRATSASPTLPSSVRLQGWNGQRH